MTSPVGIPVLDIGGTHVTAAVVDPSDWRVVAGSWHRRAVDGAGAADTIVATFCTAARTVAADAGRHWGIAMPDPFDYASGVAWFAGVGKFESLYGVDVRQEFLQGIAPPPESVAFLNDADAFLLGEWVAGAAQGVDRCVALTLGTGIGSAWLAGGEVVGEGASVPPDGRAHRIVHSGTALEDGISRRALRGAYADRTGDTQADVREICERARTGERAAGEVVTEGFRFFGAALAPYLDAFGAELIVVGGSMAASWDLFEPAVRAGAGTPLPRTVVSPTPDDSALVGAAVHAHRDTVR